MRSYWFGFEKHSYLCNIAVYMTVSTFVWFSPPQLSAFSYMLPEDIPALRSGSLFLTNDSNIVKASEIFSVFPVCPDNNLDPRCAELLLICRDNLFLLLFSWVLVHLLGSSNSNSTTSVFRHCDWSGPYLLL